MFTIYTPGKGMKLSKVLIIASIVVFINYNSNSNTFVSAAAYYGVPFVKILYYFYTLKKCCYLLYNMLFNLNNTLFNSYITCYLI